MAIYKDKKRGTYYVSVYVETKDKKRKRILRRGFKTRAEARKAESELIFNASFESSDNPLFEKVVDDFIEGYAKRRKESSTHRLKKECRLYIKPFFKSKYVQDIRRPDIVNFHDFLLDKLSVRTSKNVHGFLVAILNYAITMEYINKNVASEVGNIRATEERRFKYWTLEEFKGFLKTVDSLKHQTLFMLLFYSGCRVGEALALTWKDINFNNNTIDINKTTTQYQKVNSPKTKSSIRVLKMPNHTMNLLRQYKLQTSPKITYFVFGRFHDPMSRNAVQSYYNQRFEMTTIKRIRVHDLRHSHAAYLINNKFDIQIVSKRLGHAKVSTTYDYYSHLYPNREDEAIEFMENDFKPVEVVKLPK